ncbi:MAG: hypothetical protein IQL11_15625 [Bacteroidales bacterium]|nr:hypothetical protein [Bacteroidales bacterium]
MKSKKCFIEVVALGLFLLTLTTYGQNNSSDVYWHTDASVKTCSMVIDPSLTQDQWKRFTRQVGEITSLKSMSPAVTIGKKHFVITIEESSTPVDQHDLAWINTFTHPDENCPLGDKVKVIDLRARFGVSDKIDIGAVWTTAPGANYGMIGGDLKYAFLEETRKRPSAALRASYIAFTGVPDFNLNIGSIDLLASKKIAGVSPYLGVRESLITGTETTSKVELEKESLLVTQGFVGVSYSIWRINLAIEYNISDVNTFSFAVGFQSFKHK